jgi:ribose-phosphate pyrophosphokinase
MPGAEKVIVDPAIDRVVVTDTVPPFRLPAALVREKVEVLPAAPLLAEAIGRLHTERSLGDLVVF